MPAQQAHKACPYIPNNEVRMHIRITITRVHEKRTKCARALRTHGLCACISSERSVGVYTEWIKCACTASTQSVLARQAHKECVCSTSPQSVRVHNTRKKRARAHQADQTCACTTNPRSMRVNFKCTRCALHTKRTTCALAHQARKMCRYTNDAREHCVREARFAHRAYV